MSSIYKIHAALFDMDGVLADTKKILFDSWKTTFDKYQISIKPQTLDSMILGVLDYNKIIEFIDGHSPNIKRPDLLIEEAEELYRKNIPYSIKPMDGLIDFLQELKSKPVKTAVTTSAKRVTTNIIIDALNIRSYFDCFVCAEDVIKRKPDPQVFQIASEKLKVTANKCVVFEDAPDGIEAAKKISMVCVALKTTFPDEVLAGADLMINTFQDFPWSIFKIDKE